MDSNSNKLFWWGFCALLTTVATLILVNVYAAVSYKIPNTTDIGSDVVSGPFEIIRETFDEQPDELLDELLNSSEDRFVNTPAPSPEPRSAADSIATNEPFNSPAPTIPATTTAAPTETAEPYSPFIEKG